MNVELLFWIWQQISTVPLNQLVESENGNAKDHME